MDDTLHIILAKLTRISSRMERDQILEILDDIKRLVEIEISASPQAPEEKVDGDDFKGSWWLRIREGFACWLVSF